MIRRENEKVRGGLVVVHSIPLVTAWLHFSVIERTAGLGKGVAIPCHC